MIFQKGIKFMRYSWFDKEYLELWEYMESKASKLNNHELKEGVEKAGYFAKGAPNNYGCFDYEGRHLCFFASKSFSDMMEYQYKTTFHKNQECFGTGNASDVVDALYKDNELVKAMWSKQEYIDWCLRFNSFCYVVEKLDDKFDERVLRIDLCRLVQEDKNNPGVYEFTSGLFHALKHFQAGGKSLSTGKGYEVGSIDEVVLMCVLAFFKPEKPNRKDNVVMFLPLPDGKCLEAVFYHEKESNVYTITSLHVTGSDDVK